MADRRADIMAGLEKGCEDSIAFFKSLTAEELTAQVYQDGAKWTARQVLAHFITVERSMHWLFKNIASGGSGSPEDFDIERFNRTQTSKLDGLTLDELISQFKAVRDDTISFVRELSEDDLDREGRTIYSLGLRTYPYSRKRNSSGLRVIGHSDLRLNLQNSDAPAPVSPSYLPSTRV
jgi:hypothetical protein